VEYGDYADNVLYFPSGLVQDDYNFTIADFDLKYAYCPAYNTAANKAFGLAKAKSLKKNPVVALPANAQKRPTALLSKITNAKQAPVNSKALFSNFQSLFVNSKRGEKTEEKSS